MSTTTTSPPAGDDLSPDPTGPRPKVTIPGFAQAREIAAAVRASATGTTTDPATMAPRETGSSPGPTRTSSTTTESAGSLDENEGPSGERIEPAIPSLDLPARRTRTSTAGERASRADLAAAIAGAVFVLAGFTAWAVARRGRWELRVPSDRERGAMAEPLARIVDRHVGAAFLTPDLVDGVAAASAVASYAATNPLRRTGEDELGPDDDPFDEGLDAHGYQAP